MTVEQGIDELIEAGWRVLHSDFDEGAFQEWRSKAAFWINALLESDHVDAKLTISSRSASGDYTRSLQGLEHSTGRRRAKRIAN